MNVVYRKPRQPPRDLGAEPPYPGRFTVCLSIRHPDHTIHMSHPSCNRDDPHPITDCGVLRDRPGIVYVFEPEPGLLKVGYTRNIVQRLATFQVNHSLETQVLRRALVREPLLVEDLILTALIPWRLSRTSEWLKVPPEEYYGVLAVFDLYAEEYAYLPVLNTKE